MKTAASSEKIPEKPPLIFSLYFFRFLQEVWIRTRFRFTGNKQNSSEVHCGTDGS